MTATTTDQAVAWFNARLAFQTDVSDVHAGLNGQAGPNSQAGLNGDGPEFALVDSRADAAWEQAHIPGALHLPTNQIPLRAAGLLDLDVPVVTYCWGPGCNGATRAALALARLGYQVREMIGGIEYWIREGFAVQTPAGLVTSPVDRLTAPVRSPSCAC